MPEYHQTFTIAVLPGDGIGHEVMPVCVDLLQSITSTIDAFKLEFQQLEAGAGLYQRTGEALPNEIFDAAERADAILLGAMGLPDIRYADGREIAPQLDLRERLALYAGVRPIKALVGLPPALADKRAAQIDLIIVRESTEGLFATRSSGTRQGEEAAIDKLVVTRAVSERLFDFAFNLAQRRMGKGLGGQVTCVDKANVLGSMAFFREIFIQRAQRHPDLPVAFSYVDAMALNLVKQPWNYDVLVMENMFGDILSDLGAALIGGMGMAPSADIGDRYAVFQPCHGSAPDIAGQGKANPTAMFLSAAMMLDWLGERHACPQANDASARLWQAVQKAFVQGDLMPFELGGRSGTQAIYKAVIAQLEEV